MTTAPRRIAIVGGGASGVLAAAHLARTVSDAEIAIVEPRALLGTGVAYSTTEAAHLLNVRADCLSAWPDDPDHFAAWAASESLPAEALSSEALSSEALSSEAPSSEAPSSNGLQTRRAFFPRASYAAYLRAQLGPVDHVRGTVTDVEVGDELVLRLDDGTTRTADRVVLALGPVPATWPAGLGGPAGHGTVRPWWVGDPWAPGALAGIDAQRPVVLVGTGLTAVDIALSLRARGAGRIVAVSRHGFVPAAHSQEPTVTDPVALDEDLAMTPTARSLLSWARRAEARTGDWRSVVDSLRPVTNELWARLSPGDQRRLLRHAHRRWEVVRHRMAPPVAEAIAAMRRDGQLRMVGGGVVASSEGDRGVTVVLRHERIEDATVVNCTGGTLDVRASRDPLLRQLVDRGVLRAGPLGTGIDTDAFGAVPGTGDRVWVVGPLRRGRLWETTAVPEIREQAVVAAGALGAGWRMVAV